MNKSRKSAYGSQRTANGKTKSSDENHQEFFYLTF